MAAILKNGGDSLLPHYTALQLKYRMKLFLICSQLIYLLCSSHKTATCLALSVTFVQCTKVQTPMRQIRVLAQRSVKIGHIFSGRMTVQFDNNWTDQTKVCGWVEGSVGRRTRVVARSGGLMPVTCVEVKGTDPSAHAGEQNISITFILTQWGFKFLSHGLCKR